MPLQGVMTARGCAYAGSKGVVFGPIKDAIHVSHGPIGCGQYSSAGRRNYCETVCLAGAISIDNNTFVINPALCNECTDLDTPRCIAICPEAGVITYPYPNSQRTTCTDMQSIK